MTRFLKSGPLLKELHILMGLGSCEKPTQAELGRAAGLSPAMVNNYLARLASAGVVRRKGTHGRDVAYELTAEGTTRRDTLLVDYNRELMGLISVAKTLLLERLCHLFPGDPIAICLCPAGDTTEVAASVLRDLPHVQVLSVLDDSPIKHKRVIGRHMVQPIADLSDLRVDGVLICTVAYADRIEQRIQEEIGNKVAIYKLL